MSIRVTCINKNGGNHDNPHVAIAFLSWTNPSNGNSGKTSRVEMHNWVKDGGEAYVQDAYGNKAYLIAKLSADGNPYVQTIADGTPTDNLLRLPECR